MSTQRILTTTTQAVPQITLTTPTPPPQPQGPSPSTAEYNLSMLERTRTWNKWSVGPPTVFDTCRSAAEVQERMAYFYAHPEAMPKLPSQAERRCEAPPQEIQMQFDEDIFSRAKPKNAAGLSGEGIDPKSVQSR